MVKKRPTTKKDSKKVKAKAISILQAKKPQTPKKSDLVGQCLLDGAEELFGGGVPPGELQKKERGRPPMEFNQAFADILCQAVARTERSIVSVINVLKNDNPGFPGYTTIKKWLIESEDFAAQYARAKEDQADYLAEQIIEIADDSSEDEIFIGGDDETGAGARRVMNSEFVQRSKLRVDARKWIAAKLKPKKYGERILNEHSGEGGGPIIIEIVRFGDGDK